MELSDAFDASVSVHFPKILFFLRSCYPSCVHFIVQHSVLGFVAQETRHTVNLKLLLFFLTLWKILYVFSMVIGTTKF